MSNREPSKDWERVALERLESSLLPLPHEKNELDWKTALSPDSGRLVQHLSAFANHPGGGFLVFGIDDTGTLVGIDQLNYRELINQLGNMAREALTPPIVLDHTIVNYNSVDLLIIYLPESIEKPVYLRGRSVYDSYVNYRRLKPIGFYAASAACLF